jgi:hypothetical protein
MLVRHFEGACRRFGWKSFLYIAFAVVGFCGWVVLYADLMDFVLCRKIATLIWIWPLGAHDRHDDI